MNSGRLLSLDVKMFGDTLIQPSAVEAIKLTFDKGGGAYLDIVMASGATISSYRADAADTATMARLKVIRDSLVDRINEALVEAREPAPGPAEPEKVRLT